MKVSPNSAAGLVLDASAPLPALSARPVILALLGIAFFTSSFDVFLVFTLGGATLRICQIALLFLYVLAAGKVVQTGTILWPRGGYSIVIWCAMQGVVLLRSPALLPSFGLYCLLIFTVFGVFASLQLGGRAAWLESLLRIYLYSFLFNAAFGLFQFIGPSVHLAPFIQQWIVHGVIPRVSGFAYEPSFYATYLIMGWITLIELRSSGAAIVAGRRWLVLTWLVTLVLLLSTSKTALLVMIAEGIARGVPVIARLLRSQSHRLRRGDLRVPLPKSRLVIGTVVTVVLGAGVAKVIDLNIFLSGTGINNQPAHSVLQRTMDFRYTAEVLQEHPWFGSSLGGVAARVTQLKGKRDVSVADIKINFGFPVPVEILAASGIVGFIPFVWFFVVITAGERRLIRENWSDERAKWLRALIRALIFEWLALFADQNLVRMYLWFHITMIVIVAYNLRHVRAPQEPGKSLVGV